MKTKSMYHTNKTPNSKGSKHNAFKLSSIALGDKIEHQPNCVQILIGCDEDDIFYKDSDEGRLKAYIETKNPNALTSFDLQEFIENVRLLCPQLFNYFGVVGSWKPVSEEPKKPGKYFVCRKDGKMHKETWNGTGWAYNNKTIVFWSEILKPNAL